MRNLTKQVMVAAAVAIGACGVAYAEGDGGDNSMSPFYGESWARLGDSSNYESRYLNPNRVVIVQAPGYTYRTYTPAPAYEYRTYTYTYETPRVYGGPQVYIVERTYSPYYGATPTYNFPDSLVSHGTRFRNNTGE